MSCPQYEFDTPEALLLNVNGRWLDQLRPVAAEAMRTMFERDFGPGPLLVDQYGKPLQRTREAPRIGTTLTIRRPQRWQAQMESAKIQQEAQDASHARLLAEYGPEGMIGQQ